MSRRDKALANVAANLAKAVKAAKKSGGSKVKPPSQTALANVAASLNRSVKAAQKRGRKGKS